MNKNFRWTEEKIKLLEKYYPTMEWDELCEILGNYNKSSIITQASKRKIPRNIYNECHRTQEQIDFVLKNYNRMTATEMSRELGCSLSLVIYIAKDNNLKIKDRIKLKKEDEEKFIELYPKYTNKYLKEKYFPYLTVNQIRAAGARLGLVKTKEKSIKWYDKEDLLDKLERVIKEHGRVPMLIELQLWGLPSEKTFERYFGGLTKACQLLGIERPNYLQPIVSKTGVYYDERGNACLSQSELLISNFLIKLGVEFEKDPYYKEVIPYERCGNKRFDWRIGDKYIEFFGLENYKEYNCKTDVKISLCKEFNIKLLDLRMKDMMSTKWKEKIINFLK